MTQAVGAGRCRAPGSAGVGGGLPIRPPASGASPMPGKRQSGRPSVVRSGTDRDTQTSTATDGGTDVSLQLAQYGARIRNLARAVATLRKDVDLFRVQVQTQDSDERAMAECQQLQLEEAVEWLVGSSQLRVPLLPEFAADPTVRQTVAEHLHALSCVTTEQLRQSVVASHACQTAMAKFVSGLEVASQGHVGLADGDPDINQPGVRRVLWETALDQHIQQQLVDAEVPAMSTVAVQCLGFVSQISQLTFSLLQHHLLRDGLVVGVDTGTGGDVASAKAWASPAAGSPAEVDSPRALSHAPLAGLTASSSASSAGPFVPTGCAPASGADPADPEASSQCSGRRSAGGTAQRMVEEANLRIRLCDVEGRLRVVCEIVESDVGKLAATVAEHSAALTELAAQVRNPPKSKKLSKRDQEAEALATTLQEARASKHLRHTIRDAQAQKSHSRLKLTHALDNDDLDGLSDAELSDGCFDEDIGLAPRVRLAQKAAERIRAPVPDEDANDPLEPR